MKMDLSTSTLSLAASYVLAACLTDNCFTPPNPIRDRSSKDRAGVFFANPKVIAAARFMVILAWTYHILLLLTLPYPPQLLCPTPQNLSPITFTWNTYTVVFLMLSISAAAVRIAAFRHLGRSFTFQLTKPKKLVTGGPYRYVQHPSYPTLLLVVVNSGMALLTRPDGIAGCFLPEFVVNWEWTGTVWTAGFLLSIVISCVVMWIRVLDEEELLRKAFGEEWEVYHRKTKRFIPGIVWGIVEMNRCPQWWKSHTSSVGLGEAQKNISSFFFHWTCSL